MKKYRPHLPRIEKSLQSSGFHFFVFHHEKNSLRSSVVSGGLFLFMKQYHYKYCRTTKIDRRSLNRTNR